MDDSLFERVDALEQQSQEINAAANAGTYRLSMLVEMPEHLIARLRQVEERQERHLAQATYHLADRFREAKRE